MAENIRKGWKVAKPILSTDYCEAHKRVMRLYRGYYRYIPYISKFFLLGLPQYKLFVKHFDVQKNEDDCKRKLRECFYRNACVTDLRIIDILVMKGFMNLKEITHQWQQKGHIMANWYPTVNPKPCGFLNKFLANED